MYLLHFSTVAVSQNFTIPSISSCFVLGLTSLIMNFLSSRHKFSIGFKSGNSAGVFHQLIPLLVMKLRAKMEVCLGSLSCMKRWGVVGKLTRINGISVWLRMEVNRNLSMIPSKIQIPVRPLRFLPRHGLSLGVLVY